MVPQSIRTNFHKVVSLLTKEDKAFIKLMIGVSLLMSLVEMIGISAVMPFIAVASNFKLIEENEYLSKINEYTQLESEVAFVSLIGVGILSFFILRGLLNFGYYFLLSYFQQSRYHHFSSRLFRKYLSLSYKDFTRLNSSELLKGIVTEASIFTGVIQACLFMVAELFVIIAIYSMMLYVNWKVTVGLSLFLLLNGAFLMGFLVRKMKREGDKRANFQKYYYEVMNSTFGNFKLIKLMGHNEAILNKFKDVSWKFTKSSITSAIVGHTPRIYLETVAFGLVVATVTGIVWFSKGTIVDFLPVISVFVLGLYRLMPSANRIMNSYNEVVYCMSAVNIVYEQMNWLVEDLGDEKVDFSNSITLKDIYFNYLPEQPVLSGASLKIYKGDKVAFVGESGSGKSTLVDIIIGLYQPSSGTIYLDEKELTNNKLRSFRRKVGYIPQTVYLFDGTVAENVAFEEKYDEEKVREALRKANILSFLEEKLDGLSTAVGEGGVRLSGGQRQRIAIARALYTDPEILVLDEATSALDDETESKIMDEIYKISKGKTLIMIAHRLSTLSRCERKFLVEKQLVKEVRNESHDLSWRIRHKNQ